MEGIIDMSPKSVYIRRGEVMEMLGIGWRVMKKLIDAEKIKEYRLVPGGKTLFYRKEVEQLIDKTLAGKNE
jgi:hypothetical protein